MWINGTAKTTQIGYVNRNNQKNHGTRGTRGTKGTDVFHRKCPKCQGGNAGIKY